MSLREPKVLKRTEFGNPILQTKTKKLAKEEVLSEEIQQLIADMRHTVSVKKYGVGIAATQVGQPIALSVISMKKKPSHPNMKEFDQVIVNPSFEGLGKQDEMWEGCISFSAVDEPVFAKAVRFKRIRARWMDERGEEHQEDLDGLVAHVFQHETDHLNGILFPERVKDHRSWMNTSEYKKMILKKKK